MIFGLIILRIYFPNLTSWTGILRIDTTVSGFDCSSFDLLPSPYENTTDEYHCRAIPAGTSNDTAIHAVKSSKSFSSGLSSASKIGIGIGISVAGILILYFVWKYYTKRPKVGTRTERVAIRTATGRASIMRSEDNIESGHELPIYRRTGLLGEAPPEYKDGTIINENRTSNNLGTSSHQETTENQNSAVAATRDGTSEAHGHSVD